MGCIFVDGRTHQVIARAFNRTNLEKNVPSLTPTFTSTRPPSLLSSPDFLSFPTPPYRRRVTVSLCALTTSSFIPAVSTLSMCSVTALSTSQWSPASCAQPH